MSKISLGSKKHYLPVEPCIGSSRDCGEAYGPKCQVVTKAEVQDAIKELLLFSCGSFFLF